MSGVQDVYILKRNDKPVFATIMWSMFEQKKEDFVAAGIPLEIKVSSMTADEHWSLLRLCTENIIALKAQENISMEMVDKS